MPHHLVEIRGDAYRAMGLLALRGIQNIPSREEPRERVTARLSSDSAEAAREAGCWLPSEARGSWWGLLGRSELRKQAALGLR
jgi:hypothetical protein